MRQRFCLLACAAGSLAFAACLDALYEDPVSTGFSGSWVVCCLSGHINTCPCDAGESCAPELLACAAGACAPNAAGSCSGGHDGGSGGDGGTTGGDGGTIPGDGGSQDGGQADGGDGGSGADAGTTTTYAPCCTQGLVSTCACGPGGCDGGAFTPCQGGRCVLAGETCP